MKALVFDTPGQANVRELQPPEIGPSEILVRSGAVGICRSDFELLEGKYTIPIPYPVIPGHEWAGEVVEVGTAVSGYARGDRVIGEAYLGPEDHFGFNVNGAMAEYFKVRPEWLHHLPENLSLTQGALVEPFTIAYCAVSRAGIDASDSTVIFGAGTIGLCCVAVTKARGGHAIVVEPMPERRATAERLGADATVDPGTADVPKKVQELTEGRGADVVLEASGSPAAQTAALEVASYGAQITFIGINVDDVVPAKLGLIQQKALQIRGHEGSPHVWPAALRFLARTGIDLSSIVTATFPLSQALHALRAANNTSENIKVHVVNESSRAELPPQPEK